MNKIGKFLLVLIFLSNLVFFACFINAERTEAGVGDYYIARAPGTNLITNFDSSETALTYDTEVQSSPDISRQPGNQAFRIQNSGRYLIIANTRFNYAPLGNNHRHVVRSLIKLGGTALPSVYGMASGYGRDSGNADEDGVVVVAYVDHTVVGDASDDISVYVQNFGYTGVALANQFADSSGIQIIRLKDDDDYLQVKNTTGLTFSGTMDYSVNDPTWTEFGWTTQDVETDPSVIEWVSGNDITLKSAGHYLVVYSVRANTTGSNRRGATYRLKLSDTEIPSSRVVSYMRGSNGSLDSWVQWAGVINASANDILNIDWAPAAETAGGSLTEAAMTVVKLPDTADYLRIHYDTNRAGETTGAYPFNQEDEDDLGVHDNSINNTRISGDSNNHDWLLFGSWFLRNVTADSTRTTEHFRWFRTGTEVQYGSGLSYTRGDQSSTGVPAGGRIAAFIADALGVGEYIEFNMRLESGTGNQNRDFIADQVGISGVALDTIFRVPNTPTQNTPLNGATGVSVTPTFTMTGTDSDLDNLGYKVTIYDNSGCTSVVQTNDQAVSSAGWTGTDASCTGSPTSCYASGTQASYTTQSSLSNGTQYWWKASAQDPDGTNTFTDSSTCNTFTTVSSGNTLPVASAVSIDSDAASVTLIENTTKNVVCAGTVTDSDGYADITSVKADFYRTSVGTGGGVDDNNYYQLLGDSECIPSGGSGNSETYTCTFAIQYFADPTDASSPNSADDWTCLMTPTDGVGDGTTASDTIEMDSLIALDVTSSIAYGTLDPNTDSGAVNQQTIITNTGNRDMDPQLSGTDMTCSSNTIVVGSQKYSATSFTFSSGGTALTTTPTTLNVTLPQRTSTVITDVVYWGIGIPDGTPACDPYSGTNTFSATAGI